MNKLNNDKRLFVNFNGCHGTCYNDSPEQPGQLRISKEMTWSIRPHTTGTKCLFYSKKMITLEFLATVLGLSWVSLD